MIIKRFGVFSIAKLSGILFAVMGLVCGILISAVTLLSVDLSDAGSPQPPFSLGVIGAGAFIFLPILGSVFGFLGGAFIAWAYKIISHYTGGVEIYFGDSEVKSSEIGQ